jgi:hypothetical protein
VILHDQLPDDNAVRPEIPEAPRSRPSSAKIRTVQN